MSSLQLQKKKAETFQYSVHSNRPFGRDMLKSTPCSLNKKNNIVKRQKEDRAPPGLLV